MTKVLTLKQFQEMTKDLPGETKIVIHSNDIELGNIILDAVVDTTKVIMAKKDCRDMFDGTWFQKDAYRPDKENPEAEQVILIHK